MTYIVSESIPPPFQDSIEYWERSEDPSHPLAFPREILPLSIFEYIYYKFFNKRKTGWMAIDSIENAIGFISDGTKYECDIPSFIKSAGVYGSDEFRRRK